MRLDSVSELLFDLSDIDLGQQELPGFLHFASGVLLLLVKPLDDLFVSGRVKLLIEQVDNLSDERYAIRRVLAGLGILIEDLDKLLKRVLNELVLYARNFKGFAVQEPHDEGVGLVEFGALSSGQLLEILTHVLDVHLLLVVPLHELLQLELSDAVYRL